MKKMTRQDDLAFYRGKRVLLTGHMGFKGIWLSKLLLGAGTELTGFSLASPTADGARLFEKLKLADSMRSIEGDVRDLASLRAAFREARPEIVVHLAAQPLVRESYRTPVETYAVNVMGTAHVLECVRESDTVRSFLNVTTDKVYENKEWEWGYREDERLMGFDPYSNSKSCSELVTASYRRSFFADGRCAVSTARAGNVIGGGDFAEHRIIPDAVRAAYEGVPIRVRRPHSTRPYQHVLEPLYAHLDGARGQRHRRRRLLARAHRARLYPSGERRTRRHPQESRIDAALSACLGASLCVFTYRARASKRSRIGGKLQCRACGLRLRDDGRAGRALLPRLGRGRFVAC